MHPQRLSIKLFATQPIARAELHPFIGVFHRFIQESAVPGLLIDVADYAHVPDGPGVILIGHEVDYGIDLAGGRTGLLTTRKRAGDAGLPDGLRSPAARCAQLAELFRDTLGKALVEARAIEADDTVSVRFASVALEIACPDRLASPITASAFEWACKELKPIAASVFGAAAWFENAGGSDPRRLLTLRLSGDGADLAARIARLEKR
ncbi:MAG: hypothetical protein ACREI7_00725 [Myxococcota bacterium]